MSRRGPRRLHLRTVLGSQASRIPNSVIIEGMRPSSLANAAFTITLAFVTIACGRRGDPIPRPRVKPRAPQVRFLDLRTLEVVLPERDVQGGSLEGVEKVRLLYIPVGSARPLAAEVAAKGEVILEHRRPDIPAPGKVLRLDLRDLDRAPGWLVVVAVRVGDVSGLPCEPLPWLDRHF